jgi:hypothetical protein
VLLLVSLKVYSQTDSFFVTKEPCTFLNKYKGYKLVLNHKKDSLIYSSSRFDYGLHRFINLNDSSKLLLIGQLLAFEMDSSFCCLDVIGHSFSGIEGCRGVPDSKRYPVQIDALYMINRLCWPNRIEQYSCYNVLNDTLTKKEINKDYRKIATFFQDYKEWYQKCNTRKTISKYFPFSRGRIVWFRGRK